MNQTKMMKRLFLQVNVLVKRLLEKDPDQWTFYQDYVTSFFHIVDTEVSGEVSGADKSVEDIVGFINQQMAENPKCRGPSLALVELHSRQVAKRHPDSSDGELTHASSDSILLEQTLFGLFSGPEGAQNFRKRLFERVEETFCFSFEKLSK